MKIRAALLLAFAAVAAQGVVAAGAKARDDLDSPECRSARAAMEQTLESKAASAWSIDAAKKRTAQACFGTTANPSPNPGRVARPPLSVPPPATAARPASPAPASPPPLAVQRPPAAITSCDTGGCWDSNGARLNRVGPMLSAPGGPCTVQGAFANCP